MSLPNDIDAALIAAVPEEKLRALATDIVDMARDREALTCELALDRDEAIENGMVAIRSSLSPALPDRNGGWLPIETAPRDKTRILLFGLRQDVHTLRESAMRTVGHYYSTAGGSAGPIYWFKIHGDIIAPTHWQPLPAPPQPETEECNGKE